jgi:hypothetical protein
MGRFRRQCADCSKLTFETRCEQHESEYRRRRQRAADTPERIAKKRYLYGGRYAANRAQVIANAKFCHLCGGAFVVGDNIEADHLYPELGSASPLAAAHRSCNQSRGDKPLG